MNEPHEIRVKPCGDGWAVECDDICQPIVFLSGGRAERHGRTMALAIARAGYEVRMFVSDRDGVVIAAGRYFAVESESVWLSVV